MRPPPLDPTLPAPAQSRRWVPLLTLPEGPPTRGRGYLRAASATRSKDWKEGREEERSRAWPCPAHPSPSHPSPLGLRGREGGREGGEDEEEEEREEAEERRRRRRRRRDKEEMDKEEEEEKNGKEL